MRTTSGRDADSQTSPETAAFCCWRSACRPAVPSRCRSPPYDAGSIRGPRLLAWVEPIVRNRPMASCVRDWWTLQRSVLNGLEAQALTANPDLQAAAERFVQSRDVMMKARSQYLPVSAWALTPPIIGSPSTGCFAPPDSPLEESSVGGGGLASLGTGFLVGAPQRQR